MSDDNEDVPVLPETTGTPEPRASEGPAPFVARPAMPSLEIDAPVPAATAVPRRTNGPEQAPVDVEALVREELALDSVVGSAVDPEAPLLPLSDDEPQGTPSIDPELLKPDAALLAGVSRLAGAAANPQAARAQLLAALTGGSYDPRALPDARAFVLGMARVLVASGISAEVLADAIIAAMLE